MILPPRRGGGVSSALDEALGIVSMLFDDDLAKAVQVDQYFPDPPVHGSIVPNTECSLSYQPPRAEMAPASA